MDFKLHQDECNIDNVMMRVKNETLNVYTFFMSTKQLLITL